MKTKFLIALAIASSALLAPTASFAAEPLAGKAQVVQTASAQVSLGSNQYITYLGLPNQTLFSFNAGTSSQFQLNATQSYTTIFTDGRIHLAMTNLQLYSGGALVSQQNIIGGGGTYYFPINPGQDYQVAVQAVQIYGIRGVVNAFLN